MKQGGEPFTLLFHLPLQVPPHDLFRKRHIHTHDRNERRDHEVKYEQDHVRDGPSDTFLGRRDRRLRRCGGPTSGAGEARKGIGARGLVAEYLGNLMHAPAEHNENQTRVRVNTKLPENDQGR